MLTSMTDMGKKSKDGAGSGEDDELWAAVVKDVRALDGRKNVAPSRPRAKVKLQAPRPREIKPPPAKGHAGTGLDRRTDEKLRRGKMEIEGRLDLHGMTRAEAKGALDRFVRGSYTAGRRCVLVITGKGKDNDGVLKNAVPEWLEGPDLKGFVLRFYPARAQHGGGGALYILLRRKRD